MGRPTLNSDNGHGSAKRDFLITIFFSYRMKFQSGQGFCYSVRHSLRATSVFFHPLKVGTQHAGSLNSRRDPSRPRISYRMSRLRLPVDHFATPCSHIKCNTRPKKPLTSLPAAAAVCPTEWIFALTNIAQTLVEPIHWKQTWFHRPLVASRVLSEATSLFLIVNRIVSLGRVCTRHNITVSFLSPANTHNKTFSDNRPTFVCCVW